GPLYLLSQGPSIIGGSGNFPHFVHQLDCIGADISDPVAAVRSHRASLISSIVARWVYPAFFTTTSIRPNFFLVWSRAAFTASSSLMFKESGKSRHLPSQT